MKRAEEYSDTLLYRYAILFALIGCFLLVLSFFVMPFGMITAVIAIILFIVAGYYFKIIKFRKEPDKTNNQNETILNEKDDSGTSVLDESQEDYDWPNGVEVFGNKNYYLAYKYEEAMYIIDNSICNISGNGGSTIDFISEPDNEHDKNAIAIYLDKIKIGYVYKGRRQDMINDWIKKNYPIAGHINKIWVDRNEATYKIGFYKPLDVLESKSFPLIKTKKKVDELTTRQDNLYYCNVGDEVAIEYDYDVDNYIVYFDIDEIGELGKSAYNFIDGYEPDDIVAIIDEIDEDDIDNIKVKVRIYLK